MRFVRGDVRDPKSTTVLRSGATERFSVKVQKSYFRGIFGSIRFSAFATVSANTGRSDGASGSWQLPCKMALRYRPRPPRCLHTYRHAGADSPKVNWAEKPDLSR